MSRRLDLVASRPELLAEVKVGPSRGFLYTPGIGCSAPPLAVAGMSGVLIDRHSNYQALAPLTTRNGVDRDRFR